LTYTEISCIIVSQANKIEHQEGIKNMEDTFKQQIKVYFTKYTEAYDACIGETGIPSMSFYQGLLYGYLFALYEAGKITYQEEQNYLDEINNYGLNNK